MKDPPWKSDYYTAAVPLQNLLDIAFDAPPIFHKWNEAKTRNMDLTQDVGSSMPKEEIVTALHELLTIQARLESWYDDFINAESAEMPFYEQAMTWQNNWLDPEELTQGKFFQTQLQFRDFPTAMAQIYYDGICCQVMKIMEEMRDELRSRGSPFETSFTESSKEAFETATSLLQGPTLEDSANRVLRSVPYFFDSDKKDVGPLTFMFAFHVAFSAFCRLRKKGGRGTYRRQLRWCHMISEKYEQARLASLASLDLGRPVNLFFEMLAS